MWSRASRPSAAIALASLAGALSAQAEAPPAPRYRFDVLARPGAERCPTAERLVPAVVARVGHDPFDERAEARLSVVFETAKNGYLARIERFSADGEPAGKKSLEGPSCEALADALALSIAIAVDAPLKAAAPRPSASLPAANASTGARPIPPAAVPETWGAEAAVPAPSPEPTRLRPFAQLGAGAQLLGPAPAIAPLVALGGGITRGDLQVMIEGLVVRPTERRAGDAAVEAGITAGRLGLCARVARPVWLCATGLLGALQGAAEGAGGKRASTLFAAAGASVSAELPVASRLSLVPSLGAAFTLTRTTLYAANRPVFTTAPVGLDAGLALRLAFR